MTPDDQEPLRTSFRILFPLWVLSVVTGVLFTYSLFFGSCLSFLLIYAIRDAFICILNARVALKMVEVVLLNVLIPLLTISSVICTIYYPLPAITINYVIVSIAFPHAALLWKMSEKMNRKLLFLCASSMFVSSVISIGFVYELGTFAITPVVTSSIYSLILLCRAVHLMQGKVSVKMLKSAALVLLLICATEWIAFQFKTAEQNNKRRPGLIAESIACFLLYLCFDCLKCQQRYLLVDQWSRHSNQQALYRVSAKLLSVLIVTMWSGLAPLWRLIEDESSSIITNTRESPPNAVKFEKDIEEMTEFFMKSIYIIVLIIVHQYQYAAKSRARKEDPLKPANLSDTRTIFGLACIVAILVAMISVAIYYCLAERPLTIPSWQLLLLTAVLFLLLIGVSDFIGGFLAPLNVPIGFVLLGFIGYAIVAVIILAVLPYILKDDSKSDEPTIKTIAEDGWIDTLSKVAKLTLLLFFLIFLNFCCLTEEIDQRWTGKHGTVIIRGKYAAAAAGAADDPSNAAAAAPAANMEHDDGDNDDDNDDDADDEDGAVPAMV